MTYLNINLKLEELTEAVLNSDMNTLMKSPLLPYLMPTMEEEVHTISCETLAQFWLSKLPCLDRALAQFSQAVLAMEQAPTKLAPQHLKAQTRTLYIVVEQVYKHYIQCKVY